MSHRPRNRHPHVPFREVIDLVALENPTPPAAEVDEAEVWRKHCGSKIGYGNQSARAVAHRMSLEAGTTYEAYGCLFCASWHVGHVASVAWIAKLATVLRARAAA